MEKLKMVESARLASDSNNAHPIFSERHNQYFTPLEILRISTVQGSLIEYKNVPSAELTAQKQSVI
jgi:hypothetical protein